MAQITHSSPLNIPPESKTQYELNELKIPTYYYTRYRLSRLSLVILLPPNL